MRNEWIEIGVAPISSRLKIDKVYNDKPDLDKVKDAIVLWEGGKSAQAFAIIGVNACFYKRTGDRVFIKNSVGEVKEFGGTPTQESFYNYLLDRGIP